MEYTVTIQKVDLYWIAAATGKTNMLALLSQAWDFVKKSGIKTDGQNVAIYRRDGISAGARVFEKFDGDECVSIPAGLAAMTIHMGPYELLGEAHGAVREWCLANGHVLEGTNWEIYGHHEDDPARRRTDIYYLLRS